MLMVQSYPPIVLYAGIMRAPSSQKELCMAVYAAIIKLLMVSNMVQTSH